MKANIHPQYFQATVTCASCGTKFTLGSTQETISIELCSHCHPFYTGEQRFVDSASRISSFEQKMKKKFEFQQKIQAKKEEKAKKDNAPKSLAEMLAAIK